MTSIPSLSQNLTDIVADQGFPGHYPAEDLVNLDPNGIIRDTLYLMVYSITGLIALVGNSIVVKVVFRIPKMQTFVHIMLTNMAFSDLVCALSFFLGLLLCSDSFINGVDTNAFCVGNKAIQLLSFQVSSVTMTVAAVDRWVAVFFPFKRRNTKPFESPPQGTSNCATCCKSILQMTNISRMVIGVWITAMLIIVGTSPSLGYQRYFNKDGTVIKCELAKAFDIFGSSSSPRAQRIQLIFANLAHFWIPFTVITLAYGFIAVKGESVVVTLDNAHEFFIVSRGDCNKCPEDSACVNSFNELGDHVCYCTHFSPIEPRRKGKPCRRNTVSSGKYPSMDWHHHNNHSSIPIQVSPEKGLVNKTSSEGSFLSGSPDDAAFYISSSLIVALLISCVFSMFLMTICLIKRKSLRKNFNSNGSKEKMELADVSHGNGLLLPTERFVSNPNYESTCIDLAIRVFSLDEVKLMTQIGQGCFGKVFKGDLNGEEVAIKVVKKEYSDEAIKEVETMATFSHPNILHLTGIVRNPDSSAPWLLFEFMKHGDLAGVLRNSRHNPGTSISLKKLTPEDNVDNGPAVGGDSEEDHLQLGNESLLDFSSQIAEGMKYLSSQHFVHRDLAARNCLVSANWVVKISDFGLSRDVYTCDYYKIGGSRLLPLRWMAPESILYGRFTLESDVWAYGVLLWEIFSWGKQPYFGHNNEEVVQLILDGVLLCPPSDCPEVICRVIEGCWKTEPKDRLKFQQISPRLSTRDCVKPDTQHQSNGKNLDIETRPNLARNQNQSVVQSWIESGYEVPRCILAKDYFEVA